MSYLTNVMYFTASVSIMANVGMIYWAKSRGLLDMSVDVVDVPAAAVIAIKSGITESEVPVAIANEIKDGITAKEVPLDIQDEIRKEAKLKDLHEKVVKRAYMKKYLELSQNKMAKNLMHALNEYYNMGGTAEACDNFKIIASKPNNDASHHMLNFAMYAMSSRDVTEHGFGGTDGTYTKMPDWLKSKDFALSKSDFYEILNKAHTIMNEDIKRVRNDIVDDIGEYLGCKKSKTETFITTRGIRRVKK